MFVDVLPILDEAVSGFEKCQAVYHLKQALLLQVHMMCVYYSVYVCVFSVCVIVNTGDHLYGTYNLFVMALYC